MAVATLAVLLALAAPGGLLAGRAAGGRDRGGDHGAVWTLQAEHVAVAREDAPWLGQGMVAMTTSTIRIWFAPGVGWRTEVDTDGPHGRRSRIFGTDGTTSWEFDPLSNRYTLRTGPPIIEDPRAVLVVTMPTAGTFDFDAALAQLRALPSQTIIEEGGATVAGRPSRVLHASPLGCGTRGQASTSGGTTTEHVCQGFIRYWLDAETGCVLRAEADYGDDPASGFGGGFTWDTHVVAFDAVLNPAFFRFDPPPGSVQVDRLD